MFRDSAFDPLPDWSFYTDEQMDALEVCTQIVCMHATSLSFCVSMLNLCVCVCVCVHDMFIVYHCVRMHAYKYPHASAHAQLYLKESDDTIENKLHKKIKAEREAVDQRKKNKEAAAAAAAEQEAARAAAAQTLPQFPVNAMGLGMTANHPALVRPPGALPLNMPTPMMMVPGATMTMTNGIMNMAMPVPNLMFAEPLDHFPPRGEYCELPLLSLNLWSLCFCLSMCYV